MTTKIIAKEFDLSERQINKIFKEIMGNTIKEYLNTHRIEQSKELLLHSDLSIEQIAKSVGFESKDTFHRLFKEYCKITPGEYKTLNAQNRTVSART